MRLNLRINDRLRLTAEFPPSPRSGPDASAGAGGFAATFGEAGRKAAAAKLERGENGAIAIANGANRPLEITQYAARFAIPGGVAELVNRDDGFTLTADGDVPLALCEDPRGVVLILGESASSPVGARPDRDRGVSPGRKRPNGADGSPEPRVDLDAQDLGALAEIRDTEAKARRIQSVIDRGLLARGER